MTRYLISGVKHVFGLHRPGRKLPVRPDDIFLASYPNSGNTWLRFLIANLAHPDAEISFGNLHRLVLDPEVSTKRDFAVASRPRIIKTNNSFDPRYRRVIYVVRDPRDVAISQYASLRKARKIDEACCTEDFVERFLAGTDAANCLSTGDFGSWGENVGSWLAACSGHAGFLLLRYEDLLADTARELARVAEFVGLSTNPEKISQAIARSSTAGLAPSNWRDYLPKPQVGRIEAAWGDIMACLEYKLVTRDSRNAISTSLIGLLAAGALR
jgi:Sulfotransferase domain